MSESDFSARLPGPVTGRPRRPLSNSASTASWSIRFSLLTMISGAPRSSSRFSRLFRLITRRYRSLRSLVANRPPSSCTIGRRSGGMTGTQSSTIPVGLFLVDKKAETTFSRFRARVLRCPLPVWMVSFSELASASRSKVSRRFWIASAPMDPAKYLPVERIAHLRGLPPGRDHVPADHLEQQPRTAAGGVFLGARDHVGRAHHLIVAGGGAAVADTDAAQRSGREAVVVLGVREVDVRLLVRVTGSQS